MNNEPYDRWPRYIDWRHATRDHFGEPDQNDEGLRERKKRLMRQQISDTATAMFLERGFDEVKITEVADACNVSEKTIYNYFPTKESLVLDREDEMAEEIRRTLGPGAPQVSPVEATVQILKAQMTELFSYWEEAGLRDMTMVRRFIDLVERTPSLRAAHIDMMDRLSQVAAQSMAARAKMDPDDPEPQIAADSLLGLWRIYFRAIVKYSNEKNTPSEVRDAVLDEIRRAARLIDTGLWSFGMAVQGTSGREQIKVAAEASNEARRQVVLAIKQAKTAWRQVKDELHQQAHEDRAATHKARSAMESDVRRAVQQVQRDAQEVRAAAKRMKQEVRQAQPRGRRRPRP
jgi:AcrR family transcriptional regulator/Sec-independent protein translocase protein TatA